MGHFSIHMMTRTVAICLTVFSVIIQKKDNVNAAIQLTATPYLQTFVSHDTYNGTTYYPEGGYSREWLITGQTGNYTITIEVIECALEIQKGVCLFDYIFVYDGKNENATLLQRTCCAQSDTVPFTVQSTYGDMFVVFKTDNTFAREGFRISYILEGAPTTSSRVIISTNQDREDSKLPMYLAVGSGILVASIILIISAVCYYKRKTISGDNTQCYENCEIKTL